MNNQQSYRQNEMGIRDIVKMLHEYKRIIIFLPIIFMIGTVFAVSIFVEPSYQALAKVEIGRVNDKLLEESVIVEERMSDRSFIADVIKNHRDLFDYEKNLASEEASLQKSLVVKKLKDAPNILTFSLLAKSPDAAKARADAVLGALKDLHVNLFDGHLHVLNRQLESINQQIEFINKSRFSGRKSLAELNSYNAAVDALVMQDQIRLLGELEKKRLELLIAMEPAVTYNTRVLGNVWVSPTAVTPNYPMALMVSFFFGLFVAMFGAFLRSSLKNY